MVRSILIVDAVDLPAVSETLRKAYPDALFTESPEPPAEVAGQSFDLVIVKTESNAGLARVRQSRRQYPNACIIAVAARDRSSAAYMAGANDFVLSYDSSRLVQAVQEALTESPQILATG